MGTFLPFKTLEQIARKHSWRDVGPGGRHPHIFDKPGCRPVPCQARIDRKEIAQSLLKQLGIPREEWPENCR